MTWSRSHVSKDLVNEMKTFIISVGRGVNQIGEGLQYLVYGGKNSLVLKHEYEVLKMKNT